MWKDGKRLEEQEIDVPVDSSGIYNAKHIQT